MRWPSLDELLATDPRDSGCEGAFAILDVYVERELNHGDAARVYLDVAAHLARCGPCLDVFEGILHAMTDDSYRLTSDTEPEHDPY